MSSRVSRLRPRVTISFGRPITVMILYTTAVAGGNGEVRFYEDIYGQDTLLANASTPQTHGSAVIVAAK